MNLSHIRGVVFDFDGTLAPNLDLPEMRRQVIELSASAGVPGDVVEDLFIIEITGGVKQVGFDGFYSHCTV